MMPPHIPGPVGIWIKARLESAVFQCQPTRWEDLSMYLGQGEGWMWDKSLFIQLRQDIIAQFLECCKICEREQDIIDKYKAALDDGLQDINSGEAAEDIGNTDDEEGEDDSTVRAHETLPLRKHPLHDTQPARIIVFLGHRGSKDYDGMSVSYTSALRNRISLRIVQRWYLESDLYTMIARDATTMITANIQVIDLTWQLANKTYLTTFDVVPDDQIEFDAEFGQNRFEPPPRRSEKDFSISKSLPEFPDVYRPRKSMKSRSHTQSSSTVPRKKEYTLGTVAIGLAELGSQKWERKYGSKRSLSSSPEDDDRSSMQSLRHSGKSSNSSFLSKGSGRKAHSKKSRQ